MQKGNFLFTIDNDILIIKKNKKVYKIVKNDNNYILMYDGKKVYDNQLDIVKEISTIVSERKDIAYIISIYDKYMADQKHHLKFERLQLPK